MNVRQTYLERISAERDRQNHLPGSEFDLQNRPNDWIAIATHYLSADTHRKGLKPTSDDFEESLIKAAAVILAALEHLDKMIDKNHLSDE